MSCKFQPLYICLVGFIFALSGLIFGWYAFPILEKYLIQKNIALMDGSAAYSIWKDQPFPIKMKVFFFNVTNPDEVSSGGKPIVKDLGPYVYDEFHKKKILSINEEEDTIEYNQTKLFYFNQRDSGARSDEDVVTIINTGLLGMVIKIQETAPMVLSILDDALPHLFPNIRDIFTRDKVKNILFEGVLLSCMDEEVDVICGALKSHLPPSIKIAENEEDLLVSMFSYLNNTEDGPFVIQRGIKGGQRGELISYRHTHNIPVWGGTNSCSIVQGTDLSIARSFDVNPHKIDFFAEDLCRPLHSNFVGKEEFNELSVLNFISTDPFGYDKTLEDCYCTENPKKGGLKKCGPNGTMAMESCMQAPIFVSMPHFLMAEPSLREYIPNLNPNKEYHQTVIKIEPKTGSPITVKTRIQLNIPIRKFDGVSLFENVSEGLFPIMWMEKGGDIPENIFKELQHSLGMLHKLSLTKWFFIVVGLSITGIGFVYNTWKEQKKSRKTHPYNSYKLYPQLDTKQGSFYPRANYIDIQNID